ncbi:MAG TPA: DUF5715 family protein [Gemmatimonadaceae bacterium]|jgi:hypothetical protein
MAYLNAPKSFARFAKFAACAVAVVVPATVSAQSLRGSPASVDLMYSAAHTHDLAFLKTREDVYSAAMSGALDLITINDDLTLDRAAFPFVLPNTKRFADSLAKAYHDGCGERLAVTSGARPVDEQPRNASPESVHPTGMAVDLHKPGGKCLSWLRTNLLALENSHVVEATEEHHPAHFHVAVLSQLREPPIRAAATAVAQSSAHGGTTVGTANGDVSLASSALYHVRAGDNLWTIAERNNTTVERLRALNGLRGSRLRVGQQLKLR